MRVLWQKSGHRFPEQRDQRTDFGHPASRQQQQGIRLTLGIGYGTVKDGVTDKVRVEPLSLEQGRFEGKQAQDFIEKGGHLSSALGLPRPDRGGNQMHQLAAVAPPSQRTGDPQGQIGRVYGEHHIGLLAEQPAGDLFDPEQQPGQMRQDLHHTVDGKLT